MHFMSMGKNRSGMTAAMAVLVFFSVCTAPAKEFSASVKTSSPMRKVSAPDREQRENYRRALQFVRTMEMLRKNYVDPEKVSYEKLFNHAMQGMVSALDPYSGYEAAPEFRNQQIKRTGTTVGIGAMAVKPDGKPVTVVRVLPRSPAAAAGVRAGDQITAIDGVPVSKLNLAGALSKLRGPKGSVVTLQIKRFRKDLTVKVTRDLVADPSVPPESVKLIAGKIGFFKLTSFNRTAPEGVKNALKKLKSLGAEAIIIDLRYNPGGLVDSAVKIASQLLPADKMIFKARSRDKAGERVVKTGTGLTIDDRIPLVILINAFSASCSEILTGALQDHKRATVLGVRSFGKGTILHVVQLPGGSAVRYASAYYVTPGGRVIEGRGIIPDHELRISANEVMRLSGQSLRYPGEIKPKAAGAIRDRQLAGAVVLLQKKLQKSAAAK